MCKVTLGLNYSTQFLYKIYYLKVPAVCVLKIDISMVVEGVDFILKVSILQELFAVYGVKLSYLKANWEVSMSTEVQ